MQNVLQITRCALRRSKAHLRIDRQNLPGAFYGRRWARFHSAHSNGAGLPWICKNQIFKWILKAECFRDWHHISPSSSAKKKQFRAGNHLRMECHPRLLLARWVQAPPTVPPSLLPHPLPQFPAFARWRVTSHCFSYISSRPAMRGQLFAPYRSASWRKKLKIIPFPETRNSRSFSRKSVSLVCNINDTWLDFGPAVDLALVFSRIVA